MLNPVKRREEGWIYTNYFICNSSPLKLPAPAGADSYMGGASCIPEISAVTLGELPTEPRGAKTCALLTCSGAPMPAERQSSSVLKKKKEKSKQVNNLQTLLPSAMNFFLECNLMCLEYRGGLKFDAADSIRRGCGPFSHPAGTRVW